MIEFPKDGKPSDAMVLTAADVLRSCLANALGAEQVCDYDALHISVRSWLNEVAELMLDRSVGKYLEEGACLQLTRKLGRVPPPSPGPPSEW
jgi:hypothetical protein